MLETILVIVGSSLWGAAICTWAILSTNRRNRERAEAARKFLYGPWDHTTLRRCYRNIKGDNI